MKRYLTQTLLSALFLLLCIGAFNWWSDPYGMWRPADAEHLNRNKQVFFLRMSKPWQLSRIKPSAVIVGSSRSGSIDPAHPAWARDTPYNAAMHGLTLYEMQRVIQHAQAQGRLKKLLLAIEFDTFILAEPRVGLGFDEDRMLGPENPATGARRLLQVLGDARDTLFTSSTLAFSLQAQLGTAPKGRAMQPDGSWRYPNTDRSGRHAFAHAGRLLRKRSTNPARGTDENLAILADILAFCHQQGIDTRLYLSPEHLFMTDLRRHLGYAAERDDFIRRVVETNETVARSRGGAPFPLWAFNHLPGIVDEPLHDGRGTASDWFRDGFHFYTKLGDMIMAQAWGEGSGGRLLDSGSVDAYLNEVESLRAVFVARQEELVLDYRRDIIGEGSGR
jgi:hypothetical protein